MKRKVVSMLLAVGMVASLLAGCGSNEEPAGGSAEANGGAEETGNEGEETGDEGGQTDGEEPEEIVIALLSLAPIDEANSAHVEEELNKMMLEKINVKADFQWYDASTYATTVPMMLNGGEQLDVIMSTPVPGAGYQSYMAQNQLMDITEYVEEYGQDIKSVMGEYLEATSKDGKIYGVGNMTSLYAGAKIFMNKDVLDELGLTEKAAAVTSWSEYAEILKEVVAKTDLNGITNSDAEGTIIGPQPYMVGGDSFADAEFVDVIGDSFQYVYADPATDEVKCYFEHEGWLESVKAVKSMYDEGLVYKDASTAQDYGDTLIKNGVGFSEVKAGELGGDAAFVSTTGHQVLTVDIANAKVATTAFTKFGFGVPVTSEYPEAAVKFMNLLYSDVDFLNTLAWGVKDVDWTLNADGLATYPEGVTADTVKYHTADFLYGNRLMVTPWEGEDPDVREQQIAANAEMETSKYLGFIVDTTPVTNEITACKNVVDQYKPQLSAGSVEDVDATYAEFIEALYGAGMQTILDTYQEQLNAWLAAQ